MKVATKIYFHARGKQRFCSSDLSADRTKQGVFLFWERTEWADVAQGTGNRENKALFCCDVFRGLSRRHRQAKWNVKWVSWRGFTKTSSDPRSVNTKLGKQGFVFCFLIPVQHRPVRSFPKRIIIFTTCIIVTSSEVSERERERRGGKRQIAYWGSLRVKS